MRTALLAILGIVAVAAARVDAQGAAAPAPARSVPALTAGAPATPSSAGTPVAGAPSTAAPPGPLPRVTASLDTTSTVIGGRLLLTLRADAPEGWLVEAPSPTAELGDFRVRSIEPGPPEGTTRVFKLWLVPVKAGDLQVPPVSIRARRGNEEPIEVPSPSLAVHVASNLGAAAPGDSAKADVKPADLKPALVPPRDWRPVWIALAAALLAFLAASAILRRLRRRPAREIVPVVPKVPTRPAWEIALEELDRVAAERLVDRGELRRQYEGVTDALRRYLENRWGVPALESTTDDVRRLLQTAPVPPAFAGRVLALLSEADLVKFAKARPEPHAARACETQARELVVETIPREEPKEEAA
ncbi:MAG: hypothetical protein U0167_18090 [bacterium]